MATITVVVTTASSSSVVAKPAIQPCVDEFVQHIGRTVGGAQPGDTAPVLTTFTIA